MIRAFPLMIVPLALYNLAVLPLTGEAPMMPLDTVGLSVGLTSGAPWRMTAGDLLITVALFLLFVEILKSTRIGASVVDHILSTLVFVVFLVEFLLVREAGTAIFFNLMAIAFIDVVAGFSVSIRSAGRDVSIGL